MAVKLEGVMCETENNNSIDIKILTFTQKLQSMHQTAVDETKKEKLKYIEMN